MVCLDWHGLDDGHEVGTTTLPAKLVLDAAGCDALWSMHPAERPEIRRYGKCIRIPRWQQAYAVDYQFSGATSRAQPIPKLLVPVLEWCRAELGSRLNGLLLNWYDGEAKHYIGPHRDSVVNMFKDAPIVTISFGASRIFRLRPYRREGKQFDFEVGNGSVLILQYAANRCWTHEVPHFSWNEGRRISITARAFIS